MMTKQRVVTVLNDKEILCKETDYYNLGSKQLILLFSQTLVFHYDSREISNEFADILQQNPLYLDVDSMVASYLINGIPLFINVSLWYTINGSVYGIHLLDPARRINV